jgi:hypothetical protein
MFHRMKGILFWDNRDVLAKYPCFATGYYIFYKDVSREVCFTGFIGGCVLLAPSRLTALWRKLRFRASLADPLELRPLKRDRVNLFYSLSHAAAKQI